MPGDLVWSHALAPLERTLGEGARLVYFHGAWVWAGKIAFGAAAAAGLVGLVSEAQGLAAFFTGVGTGWVGSSG